MKVFVLVENTAAGEEFLYEHGLSLYIETKKHKILFDMGQSDAFIKNARVLGIDLKKVDIAVLSHGHYDHGGGLEAFLNINKTARVYINKNAFDDYYSVDGRYLGLDKGLKENKKLTLTGDEEKIDEELYLFTGNSLKRNHFMDTFGLLKKQGDNLREDDFLHEQYLVISEEGKNYLISGCSHKGILNIMEWVKKADVEAVFGGFHYMKLDTEKDSEYLENAARELLGYRAKYFTCHCTGEEQFGFMKAIMQKRLEYISAGEKIIL